MEFHKVIKHLIFWMLFLLLWSVHDLNYHGNLFENMANNAIAFVPYAILVYLNLYVLLPKFLLKKNIVPYVLTLTLGIVAITFCASYYLSFYFGKIDLSPSTATFFLSTAGRIAIATEVILSLCLSMTLFLLDEWYKKEGSIKAIEQQQIATELHLLSKQIRPEVLLNSLNTIFRVLGKHSDNNKKTLQQFSDILREQLQEKDRAAKDFIFIKCDGIIVKIMVNEILFINTAKDYVQIHTITDSFLTLVSLKQIEEELPKEKFVRVHRYYLVGLNHIKKIEGNLIYVGDHKITISRTLKNTVYTAVVGDKLVARI